MQTDIFIKTCQHDAEYHKYCLKSIDRFCTGFRNTVVVDSEHPKGYLQQQVEKLHSDIHCPGADYILVTDSDTLFTEPVTPESFMRNGKPMWFMTPAHLVSPDARTWFPAMKKFHGVEPTHEFMRRQPFMFPARILKDLRSYCVAKHGRTLEQYIMESGRFSEWNVLGMFAWIYHQEHFSWIDTSKELPPALVRQFWSHDPIEKNLEEINRILS